MSEDRDRRARYGEAFWRAHHEAWKRSDLNLAGVLRGAELVAESVRQLAGEVHDRARSARSQAALAARQP